MNKTDTSLLFHSVPTFNILWINTFNLPKQSATLPSDIKTLLNKIDLDTLCDRYCISSNVCRLCVISPHRPYTVTLLMTIHQLSWKHYYQTSQIKKNHGKGNESVGIKQKCWTLTKYSMYHQLYSVNYIRCHL